MHRLKTVHVGAEASAFASWGWSGQPASDPTPAYPGTKALTYGRVVTGARIRRVVRCHLVFQKLYMFSTKNQKLYMFSTKI